MPASDVSDIPGAGGSALRRVQDLTLRFAWDDAALAAAVQTALGYFALDAAADEGGSPELDLTFALHRDPVEVPDAARRLTETVEGIQFFRHADTLYLRSARTAMRVDPAAGTAHLALGGRPPADLEARIYCFLFYGMVVMLYERGLPTMHAACVTHGDFGLLIMGESRSGKSTLAMNLLREGWHHLSDDSILLHETPEAVEALPLRRAFCLTPEAADDFPGVEAHWRPHVANRFKRRVDVEVLFPGCEAARCRPRAVVFPAVVDAPRSSLEPVPARAGLFGLMEHSGAMAALDADTAARHLTLLRRASEQVRFYRLAAGRDLRDDPAAVRQLAARLLAA